MISVITPTNDVRWLDQARSSLEEQPRPGEIEWIISPNGVEVPDSISALNWVRVISYPDDREVTVGGLKRFCCEQARGDIIVELDHDDMLTPGALQAVADAFQDESVDFVYSNFAEFMDETWEPHVYNPDYGWEFRQREFYGHSFTEIVAFPPTAAAMALVHYAPNHLRAWRRDAYWEIGGHNGGMAVCDDHDLCCRFYLHKRMRHIDDCLYLYRLHGDNSYLVHNQEIQAATRDVRAKYLWRMAERWADLEGWPKVDLGAAHGKPAGYVGVDVEPGPGVDHVCNVSNGLPFDDNTVGLVRAMDFLEHIPDSVFLMNEIWRVLVDGGWLVSGTPSTDGRGAFQDPTHVAFWNENSFWYYTNRFYAEYVPGISCRFQAQRVETKYPTEFHKVHKIPYVYADLTAVKTWRRRPGLVEC